MAFTYGQAGVHISEGEQLVTLIKKPVRSTFSKSVLGDIGAFGGFFDGRFKGYKSPVLVSSMDGVGTKLKIAQMMNRHETVGQDLVNHCVNDILVCGATPLFFLDYYATGKLNAGIAARVIDGFVKACRENECSLIGGETAEMPGFYEGEEYDIAGTIVGVVEKKRIISGRKVRKGDVLIGLPSTGLHTNGYSLARAVLLERMTLDQYVEDLGTTLGEALLAVHRSYRGVVTQVLKKFNVHGLAHVTGGGIVGNTMRIVPKALGLEIDWASWERPALFRLIQQMGGVPEEDMRQTFNLGVGLVMVVASSDAEDVLKFLHRKGEAGIRVGRVVTVKRR